MPAEMEKTKEDGLGILSEGLSVDIGFLGSATAIEWEKAIMQPEMESHHISIEYLIWPKSLPQETFFATVSFEHAPKNLA